MELTTVLGPGSRILEVGARGSRLADSLQAAGHERYLGLATAAGLDALREQDSPLADRFTTLPPPSRTLRCSTDLLVLRHPFGRLLWPLTRDATVRHIAVEAAGRGRLEARAATLAGLAARQWTSCGRMTCGDEQFEVLELKEEPARRARHYLSPLWGVSGFVDRLRAAGVDYAVLRWFEDLPHLQPGEDLDMLVADRHLSLVQQLLDEEPGMIPVDVYSETGLPGADYQGMAYYPPDLARQLLARAVEHVSGARVPAAEDQLASLAYHAIYHKGTRSGLPSSLLGPGAPDPEHDYGDALQKLAGEVGVQLPTSIEALDEHLAQVGWRPPMDTLRRLAAGNAWVAARFEPAAEAPLDPPEPAVFLVRERASSVLTHSDVLGVLEHFGFEAIAVRELDEAVSARCAAQLRGGNWGPGPFPVSGGPPVTAVLAAHYGPRRPDQEEQRRYPRLSNAAVLEAKLAVRDLVAERVDAAHRFNAMHSSDDPHEAWEYVELTMPDDVVALREEVERRRAAYRTPVPVLRVLSRNRRAKVELVHGAQGPVVRKTFAPAFRRHLEREVQALTELGPRFRAVPELVAAGPTWFDAPYYGDDLARTWRRRRLLPLPVVHEMVAVLRALHEAGFDLLDAKPQNFLLDPVQGLKVIDFEFLHRLQDPRPPFSELYCFSGRLPVGCTDAPVNRVEYDALWRPFTGLSQEGLLTSPVWSQHLQRTAYRVRRAHRGQLGRRGATVARRAVPAARRRLSTGYAQWAERRVHAPFEETP